ncbi:hypothetical protein EJ04DRAFT_515875 [Polyplosphaeria fusca]|uniref:Uncharacterized protein n=1 Tax=Polyplosphaeria fusca TaxID=682080 RepID=A0A9P4QRC2_9PLEO|nr:hypothetical protein EJ04DRAFT_515875 [Polyplosphaeria fusca]
MASPILTKQLLALFVAATIQPGINSAGAYDTPVPCPSQADIPIGWVQTYSAYACRGELQTFPNVTSGVCMEAKNFTTARGYRKGASPDGVDCTFNFYASSGCKGSFVSTGKDADGSNNWIECVRNFLSTNGDTATTGASFMYSCYSRH